MEAGGSRQRAGATLKAAATLFHVPAAAMLMHLVVQLPWVARRAPPWFAGADPPRLAVLLTCTT